MACFAITSLTLNPGSCPPSPGFAPWATLICISSAFTKYSADYAETSGGHLFDGGTEGETVFAGSETGGVFASFPVLLRPCILFIAIAIVSCASLLIEPKLMAPVTKRFMISLTGSTSSIGMGFPSSEGQEISEEDWCTFSSTRCVYSLNFL